MAAITQERQKKQQMGQGPSIYGYTNYRAYLKDFYQWKKQSRHGYSYRAFSKAADFSSPNVLKLVIEGQRNISHEAIEKFLQALRLSDAMAEYFRALVQMNQSKSDQEKEKWYRRLRELAPHAKKKHLAQSEYQYLSHWLYPVIREMIELEGFSDDPHWISRRLQQPASIQEIAAALNFLIKEGFIFKNKQGKYTANDQMIITSDEVKNLAIRNYHRQMLHQAEATLETLDVSEREFGAVTLAVPGEVLTELKQRLKKFRNEIHDWAMQAAENSKSSQIIQLNFQMYPHSKDKRREHS